MDATQLVYRINSASMKDIVMHLGMCNESFFPPLSQRVDVGEYSRKISEKAVTFESWCDQELVGLLAVYFNTQSRSAYITNVSVVDNYMRLGIASTLLKMCLEHAVQKDFHTIRLDVHAENGRALEFYQKHGFMMEQSERNVLQMIRTI